ncbi:N-acetyl-alpha-D-glucosaminyl L-malate synthase [Paenibacillus solanacearum]|uniref:N-acetyl-alpha-D-glucosaminyl L-malate synthase n=1 Tax=Paenibacillus solanacearum TaxID=2048548 RepID=A0A916NK87_9BACL|nr:glycosyltransferase [Paenibacillus solanacearum]CAG7638942.1 N-acetyl-alpha-D-glucosaminyl L-malate synthase [Paenibacillus solanacearum]
MSKRKRVVAHVKNTYLNPTETFIYERIKHIKHFKGYVLADKVKYRSRFPFRRIYKLRKISNLPSFMKRKKTSVIHAYFGTSAIRILPYKRKTKIPMITSFHGKDVSSKLRKKSYRRKLRAVFKHSSFVLVVSSRMKRKVAALRCPRRKIRVIRTGIDLRKFPFKLRKTPKRKASIKFLSIGRLVPKKGMDVLVKAFAKVHRRYSKARLSIVGEGPLRSKLKRSIRKHGLSSSVRLLGKVSHGRVRKLLRKAHIFVLASKTAKDGDQEGIPNSLVEAMASGLPVVSTNHSGIPELVRHNKTGFVARQGSVKDLARKMKRMLKKRNQWRRMTRAARAYVAREHNIKKQVHKVERLYRKAIKRR